MSIRSPDPQATSGQLRLFIAVPASPAARARASTILEPLLSCGDVRWVPPAQLHLTLKFLGATPEAMIPPLQEILTEIANAFSSFVVELSGVGAFPNTRRPRTIWLGVESAGPISILAREIDQAVSVLGFPREQRPFRAHLTLGRVRSPRGLAAFSERLQRIESAGGPPERWPIRAFELIRSDLHPNGPEYTTLARFPLRPEE